MSKEVFAWCGPHLLDGVLHWGCLSAFKKVLDANSGRGVAQQAGQLWRDIEAPGKAAVQKQSKNTGQITMYTILPGNIYSAMILVILDYHWITLAHMPSLKRYRRPERQFIVGVDIVMVLIHAQISSVI